MGRVASNRKLAQALLKTIGKLEADPSVDEQDPAFVHLKCSLLDRVLSLELDNAETQSVIHLIESPERKQADPSDISDEKDDTRTA